LIHILVPEADLSARIDDWFAERLAPRSAVALRYAAAAARAGLLAHVRATLPGLERLYLQELMRTHDAIEGIEAFLAKRAPHWIDR
jgi:cyclohexa-1,5-dienecarbonyl-CoA hydratase